MQAVTLRSPRRAVAAVRVRAFDGDRVLDRPDKVVSEEPMEIRVHGPNQEPQALAVTMRTPGRDFDLAVGFCHTEGILPSADELDSVAYCLSGEAEQEFNVVTVSLRQPVDLAGHALLERALPLASEILMLSGRVSFEIVQKAAMAGIPIVCAVSAPSSLAIEAAERFGQTVVGFLRDDRANIYTRPERIDLAR